MSKKIMQISSVKYIEKYSLEITFMDNEKRVVDFYDFLNSSKNPEIKSFLKVEKFKKFKIQDGQLIWGDFELLFPIHDLYSGKISA